jgi:hypothetical protein
VPPVAALPPSSLINHGEQTHQYTQRVAFHVFVISNHNQYPLLNLSDKTYLQSYHLSFNRYNPRDEQNFNYDEFKKQVMKFCLPAQVSLLFLLNYATRRKELQI